MSGANLTNAQRKQICEEHLSDPAKTQVKLALWAKDKFVLAKLPSQAAISNILKRKDEYIKMDEHDLRAKRARQPTFPQLDTALANWVLQRQANRTAISGDMIKAKAMRFADLLDIPADRRPEFSNGWLQSFQDRHDFRQFKSYGESGDADVAAIIEQLPELQEELANYAPQDIYNMDETGLFFCMAPDRTIAKRQIEGVKKDKTRITIAFTTNSDGSHRLEPFFIGHSKQPRAFRKRTAEQHGLYYRFNAKAWMTSLLFREWLAGFDREMAARRRNVLLLLDNAPSHAVDDLQLDNTTVRMLPPRTTSKIQPMDAGVIAAFKRRYRARQLALAVDRDEAGEANIYKVDVLQAMRWAKQCWRDISAETIANCWRHTGLLNVPAIPNETATEPEVEPEVEAELHAHLLELALSDPFDTVDLVDLAVEREVHHEFTDADLVEMACTEIDDEDSEDEELMVELELATEEKLRQIRNMLVWMDNGDEALNAVVKELRRVQRILKDELLAKQREVLVQTRISSFFEFSSMP